MQQIRNGKALPKTKAKKAYDSQDDAIISRYLGVDDTKQWVSCHKELIDLLLNSGHTIDIDDSDEDHNRVSVGKLGLTLSGKGESLREALVSATVSFVTFMQDTGQAKLDQPQRARSAMPFHTALSWMIEGRSVRRQLWGKDQSLKLTQGFLPKNSDIVYGRVLGVPAEYYQQGVEGEELKAFQDPQFIMAFSDRELEWKPSTTSVLASDWELV
ncbi:hypothetical protein WB60_00095 [bacteria symbiont BFo2 of Frankliniella occidentalis]|nr:hypothetical protein WB60_00095 [bacteria symbiont BFo2 of Frankliniella occidentalis]